MHKPKRLDRWDGEYRDKYLQEAAVTSQRQWQAFRSTDVHGRVLCFLTTATTDGQLKMRPFSYASWKVSR